MFVYCLLFAACIAFIIFYCFCFVYLLYYFLLFILFIFVSVTLLIISFCLYKLLYVCVLNNACSCIRSLDKASGVTGRLCKQTMLQMYKVKQWLEPSNSYVSRGLDPGLVSLSQMVRYIYIYILYMYIYICRCLFVYLFVYLYLIYSTIYLFIYLCGYL